MSDFSSSFFTSSNSQSLAPREQSSQAALSTIAPHTEQFLRSQLTPDISVLLPIQGLLQVLTIPIDQIVCIPHMPAWVMGIYNWRGEVLWVIDLGHLCGLLPWHQQTPPRTVHRVLVLRSPEAEGNSASKNSMLGLSVSAVEDMEWCNLSEIQRPEPAAELLQLTRFLRGWRLVHQGRFAILNEAAIFAAMP